MTRFDFSMFSLVHVFATQLLALQFVYPQLDEMNSEFAEKADNSDEDPVTLMLQKTGCIELHYKVQVEIQKVSNLLIFIQFFPVFFPE